MPFYEYRCGRCGRRHTFFFRNISAAARPVCPACQSEEMVRVISPTVMVRGESRLIDEFDVNRRLAEVDWRDKGSFARWSRRLSEELGEDMGRRFQQLAEKMEAGQDDSARIDPGVTLRYELQRRRQEIQAEKSKEGEGPSQGTA